jgi:hypothetical protein
MNENRIPLELSADDIRALYKAIQTLIDKSQRFLIALEADND